MMQKILPASTENEASATPTTQLKRRSVSAFSRFSALMAGRASDARFPKTFQTPLHSTEGRTAGLFMALLAVAAFEAVRRDLDGHASHEATQTPAFFASAI